MMSCVTGGFGRHCAGLAIAMLGLLCAVSLGADDRAAQPGEGSAPPPLQVQDLSGTERTLKDYAGRAVLVNFWASWCPPCLEEMPSLERLSRAMAGRPFEILAVNVGESTSQVKRFARLEAAGIVLLRDPRGTAAVQWGVKVYPTSLLIDAEGRVRERLAGPVDWDTDPMMDRIGSLLPP